MYLNTSWGAYFCFSSFSQPSSCWIKDVENPPAPPEPGGRRLWKCCGRLIWKTYTMLLVHTCFIHTFWMRRTKTWHIGFVEDAQAKPSDQDRLLANVWFHIRHCGIIREKVNSVQILILSACCSSSQQGTAAIQRVWCQTLYFKLPRCEPWSGAKRSFLQRRLYPGHLKTLHFSSTMMRRVWVWGG